MSFSEPADRLPAECDGGHSTLLGVGCAQASGVFVTARGGRLCWWDTTPRLMGDSLERSLAVPALHEIPGNESVNENAVICSVDTHGQQVVCGGSVLTDSGRRGFIEVWSADQRKLLSCNYDLHTSRVSCVRFIRPVEELNKDAIACVSCSWDGRCVIWSLGLDVINDVQAFALTVGPIDCCDAVSLADGSVRIAAGTIHGKLFVWSIASLDTPPELVLDVSVQHRLHTVCLVHSGQAVVAAGRSEDAHVWVVPDTLSEDTRRDFPTQISEYEWAFGRTGASLFEAELPDNHPRTTAKQATIAAGRWNFSVSQPFIVLHGHRGLINAMCA